MKPLICQVVFLGFGAAHPKLTMEFSPPPTFSGSSPFSMNGTKAAETAQSTTIAAPANKCGPGKSFSARNLKSLTKWNLKSLTKWNLKSLTKWNLKGLTKSKISVYIPSLVLVKIIAPNKLIATFFGGVVVASHLNFSDGTKNILKGKLRFFILPKKNGCRLPHLTAGVFGSGDNIGS